MKNVMLEAYVAPELEVVEVVVEQGFAGSVTPGQGEGSGGASDMEGGWG